MTARNPLNASARSSCLSCVLLVCGVLCKNMILQSYLIADAELPMGFEWQFIRCHCEAFF